MNKVFLFLVVIICVQIKLVNSYFYGNLVDMNLLLSKFYLLSAGLLGTIMGFYVLLKLETRILGLILSVMVLFIGLALVGLWFLELGISANAWSDTFQYANYLI